MNRFYENLIKNRYSSGLAKLSLLMVMMLVGISTTWAATITVGPSGDYTTIQAAINAAISGDVIEVAAGTYYENSSNGNALKINKSITLVGTAGAAATIIDGNSATEHYYMISIEADNVIFDGFTVTNPLFNGTADASGILTSIAARQSNLRITNCIIHDIGTATRDDNGSGTWGINVGPVDGLEIDNNTVYNIGNGGSGGAGAILTWGNDLATSANNVNIHNNIIHDVYSPFKDYGIALGYCSQNNTAQANNVYNIDEYGINTSGSSLSSHTITQNTVNNATVAGIRLLNPFGDNVNHNSVTGCGTGVFIGNTVTPTSPEIHNNSITTSTIFAIDNQSSNLVNATCNWYGTAVDTEIAALISGNVDYTPWLLTNDLNGSCVGGLAINVTTVPHTIYDSAQEAIDAATAGDEVQIFYQPGSPLLINKVLIIHYIFNQPQ